MAKVTRTLPKKTRTLILLGATLLGVLLLVGLVLGIGHLIRLGAPTETPEEAPQGEGSTQTTPQKQEETKSELPPAVKTDPLPTSVFVKNGKEGAFSYDLYEDYAVVTRVDAGVTEPVIPATLEGKPVLAIGENAFISCSLMTNVTLPEGLREIGRCAFFGCPVLKEISLPESLNTIGESAFASCKSLATVSAKGGIQNMGPYVFEETAFLKNCKDSYVLFGDGLLIAYKGEGGSITLPSEVKKIVSLSACETITDLYIPTGVTEIGNFALAGCTNISRIIIPSTVTKIGDSAMLGCSMLTGVNTGEGLLSIGERAFAFCDNLKTVSFSKTVAKIGENLFESVTTLETIYVAPESFANAHFATSEYASLVKAETV